MKSNQRGGLIKSVIGKKVLMALTGLFLVVFLMGHLAGNLQLFLGGEAGKLQFNEYAYFMTHNPAVKLLSYITYASIFVHVADAIVLSLANRKARPIGYAVANANNANSHWTSRNMGILGTIVLAFIVIHMRNFWYEMHWGNLPVQFSQNYNKEIKDLHTIVVAEFQEPFAVILYVLAMFGVGFHLYHGVASGFQSLGLGYKSIYGKMQLGGKIFAIVVPILFASIPLYIYFMM